jgi:hypothetical protein
VPDSGAIESVFFWLDHAQFFASSPSFGPCSDCAAKLCAPKVPFLSSFIDCELPECVWFLQVKPGCVFELPDRKAQGFVVQIVLPR